VNATSVWNENCADSGSDPGSLADKHLNGRCHAGKRIMEFSAEFQFFEEVYASRGEYDLGFDSLPLKLWSDSMPEVKRKTN
jgi:hypothetical protein